MKNLSSQWHFVGLRERPKLVNTGPYALVRHPMYLCGIVASIFSTVGCSDIRVYGTAMFWNWVPLAGACLAVPAFIVKIPIEEKVLLSNKQIGHAYKRYQKESTQYQFDL
ncbi:hypothetical protein FRC10_000718 [Ceratobasidium sp. 414]|nr:hypothetical protein FRC10_000718 [Ceratobasidium sp. 414]